MTPALPNRLRAAIERIHPTETTWRERADARLDRLTKPPRSLGRLEDIAARLCAIQRSDTPRAEPRRIVVFAADHGVAAEGVSAYPAAVTTQMVGNFLKGGAAINALARTVDAGVCVVDVGVAGAIDALDGEATFVSRRVRAGTHNIAEGPAMSHDELARALDAGLDIADAAARDHVALIAFGDMGIGNTTAASAITAALTAARVSDVTGPGTGIDDGALAHKIETVTRALRVNQPHRDPLEVLRTVGGFEIAAMTAACIGAASHRIAIVGDGFIATAAALVAAELCPSFLDYWFAGHLSPEPGHRVQLAHLGQQPLLQLEMRLGEGTGAALAIHLLVAAAAMMNEMATFESAGISGPARASGVAPA
jgi:nicotinate-nucleotide--dimethylbenzimidazole phosphoribosyltransferase